MLRKLLLAMCVVMVLASGAFATAQEATQEPAAEWTCPEGFEGQTLRVFNWSTYVAEDTIPNFEEACGVTVDYNIYESNEAMLTIVREGSAQYDLLHPSDFAVEVMIEEGLLREINWDNIPNFANVGEAFLNPPYDPENVYSAPYQWGTIAIGYNPELVGEEITSWEQVFNYDGPVAWLDDQRFMFGIALKLLGYDPNTENADEIAEARDFLIENGSNVVAIAADDGQVMLERGDVDITIEYSGDIFQIIGEAEEGEFAYVIPGEGAQLWTDNLVIPANAPNPELAEVYIDYILNAQVGAELSNYTAYGSPNQAAVDQGLIDEALLSNPGIYPTEEAQANLFFIRSVGDAAQLYNEAWSEVLAALGQ